MSSLGKIALLISGFCLVSMSGARFVLGMWHPLLYGFLTLFLLGLITSIFLDYKLYLEFLSIKTAKKGLSLGWSLLILIVFLIAFSYMGNRFDRSFDLTEEGINSLSEQSRTALKNLDSDLVFYIFYKGDKISEQVTAIKRELKTSLNLYKQNNSKIKVLFIDTYKNNLKAEEYLSDLPDKNQQELFVFVNYKGRKIRADVPFSEESLTSAVIKSQKRAFKEILFLTGHGEKDLNNDKASGLKILSQSLKDSGFILKEWNFTQQAGPPKNPADLMAIIGPRQAFLDSEKAWLKNYLSNGGNLILSLDPKERQGLEDFLKDYGLIFKNNFILSQLGLLYGGATKALGVAFDRSHSITKRFTQQAVFFEKASSIDIASEALNLFDFSYLVKSHRQSFTSPELSKNVKVGELSSLNMAVEVRSKKNNQLEKPMGEKDSSEDKKTGFRLILFGDSDFLTNRYIYEGANRDLALNTFVSLAGEEELVSIRPKQPKGTKITLTRPQKMILVLIYIILPLLFFSTGLWMWYRRRNA